MTVSVGARGARSGMRLFAGALDGLLVADDLPDGFVAADSEGLVRVFNRAAVTLTGIPADSALGRPFDEVLPLRTVDGRDWWRLTDPYGGLSIRTGHPEAQLFLPEDPGKHDPEAGTELLVTARYQRRDGRSTPVTGLVVALRGTQARRRAGAPAVRPDRHRRARAALPADQREGLHRDPAGDAGTGSPTTRSG